MNRRAYILALGTTVSLSGCALLGGKTDAFSVTSPTIEQGESAVIAIEANNVAMMWISKVSDEPDIFDDGKPVSLEFENATFSPPPHTNWLTEPPAWEWQSAQDVKVEIPIQTFSDTPRTAFHFTVNVSRGSEETKKTQEATITVVSRS